MTTTSKQAKRTGFTLVELLTVMAIIALLIGLMVPALGHVKTTAKVVQQKAQLESIENALEAFSAMYGDYPPSSESSGSTTVVYNPAATNVTCGAQKLAEALLGVDMRGFDPKNANIDATHSYTFDRLAIETDRYAYAVQGMGSYPGVATVQDPTDSLNRRKGPYITVNENVNSFEVRDIYGSANTGSLYAGGEPGRTGTEGTLGTAAKKYGNVICDNFKAKTITYSSFNFATQLMETQTAKVGTPILYYKANTSSKVLEPADDPKIDGSIYNWHDNMHLVSQGRITDKKVHWWMDTTNPAHTASTGNTYDARAFNASIQNPKVGAGAWPFNADSYILISAGPDGIYGNSDDITNFGSADAK